MNEMAVADRWLYSVFSQLGTAYNGCVPEKGTFPCIVFACLGGSDLNVPSQHIWAELSYIVKVWGTEPQDTLFDSACAAIERAQGVTTNYGYIQSCARQSVSASQETEANITYYSREATFRIRVKPGEQAPEQTSGGSETEGE